MRKSKDIYLMGLAIEAASRGTCDRFRAGCVVARDGIILTTGYNGSAPGDPHCDEVGHEIVSVQRFAKGETPPWSPLTFVESQTEHCVRTIHAEINAIVNAAYVGVSLRNSDWYINGIPCMACSRALARLRPRTLHLIDGYRNGSNLEWWRERQSRLEVPKQILLYRKDDLCDANEGSPSFPPSG